MGNILKGANTQDYAAYEERRKAKKAAKKTKKVAKKHSTENDKENTVDNYAVNLAKRPRSQTMEEYHQPLERIQEDRIRELEEEIKSLRMQHIQKQDGRPNYAAGAHNQNMARLNRSPGSSNNNGWSRPQTGNGNRGFVSAPSRPMTAGQNSAAPVIGGNYASRSGVIGGPQRLRTPDIQRAPFAQVAPGADIKSSPPMRQTAPQYSFHNDQYSDIPIQSSQRNQYNPSSPSLHSRPAPRQRSPNLQRSNYYNRPQTQEALHQVPAYNNSWAAPEEEGILI